MRAFSTWVLGGVALTVAVLLCIPTTQLREQRIASSGGETAPVPARADNNGVNWEDARLLAEIMQRVRDNYVQPVDSKTLMQRAAGGMVMGLDEYSTLLDPGAYQDLKVATSGTYAGIGIEIEARGEHIAIVRVIPGSPAAKAGLHDGDLLQDIDGVAISSRNLDAATEAMRGDAGKPVTLALSRDGAARSVTIERSRVELPSVEFESLQAGMGYLRISTFTDETAGEFANALRTLREDPANPLRGLVLDLRNNPGGVLDAAVAVADDLLENGVIVSADGRTEEARFIDRATPGDASGGAAIVVMVNGGSASAAEILAAALHDNARALLVGRKTYGKGSVQTIMPLPGGRALKLTTSRYYTPSGVSLDHNGIVPDVVLNGSEPPQAQLDGPDASPTLARRDPEVGVAMQRLRDQLRVASAGHTAVASLR